MKPKNYTAYLFDLDGTLIDTAPDIMKGLNYALQQAAFETVDEVLTRRWVGHGARVLIEKALEHYGENRPTQKLLETMTSNFINHYAEHIADDSIPYPNVITTLETLSNQGKQLGVVTNKAVHLARLLLKATELDKFMDVIVGGDSMQVRKPAGEPAMYAMNELNVSSSATLFVGDASTDVGCARSAGGDCVVYRYGYNQGHKPESLGADGVIESLADLV